MFDIKQSTAIIIVLTPIVIILTIALYLYFDNPLLLLGIISWIS